MIVAELEVHHSRPIAPTRRVALGQRNLPTNPAPGAGGVLLAGILANSAPGIEPELREDLMNVMALLESGQRVVQPRVRHRYQVDRVGLLRSTHQLRSVDGNLEFVFDDDLGRPVQQALGALYAAGSLPTEARPAVFDALRSALVWGRDVDASFISALMGGGLAILAELSAWNDPVAWALELLEIEESQPSARSVNRRYRSLLRAAHPDHGAQSEQAADKIAQLGEARRILLAQ